MHLLMIVISLGLAIGVRLLPAKPTKNWVGRWQRSLILFLFPPLFLIVTAIAVLWMGCQGQMFGITTGWFSYLLAFVFIIVGCILLGRMFYQACLSIQEIRIYPQELIEGKMAKIIETEFPYSAQVGLWKSELIISRGMLNILDEDHLKAVLAHEQSHRDYRDTFWFFWLGWLRSLTAYLPKTEALWQELLLLRELRADWRAAQQVDRLLLAESLLIVTQTVNSLATNNDYNSSGNFVAAFNDNIAPNRLIERIESLMLEVERPILITYCWWNWTWIGFTLLPLVTVPWHS